MDSTITIELVISAISAKIKAIRSTLTEEQKEAFDQSLKESKEFFLLKHPHLSEELRKLVDEQYQ